MTHNEYLARKFNFKLFFKLVDLFQAFARNWLIISEKCWFSVLSNLCLRVEYFPGSYWFEEILLVQHRFRSKVSLRLFAVQFQVYLKELFLFQVEIKVGLIITISKNCLKHFCYGQLQFPCLLYVSILECLAYLMKKLRCKIIRWTNRRFNTKAVVSQKGLK